MDRLGNYELVRLLGRGGMADVYLARGYDRDVAIKMLNAEFAVDREASELFRDEARIAALLDHPNVARVYDATPTPRSSSR